MGFFNLNILLYLTVLICPRFKKQLVLCISWQIFRRLLVQQGKYDFFCIDSEKNWTHKYFKAWIDFSFPYQFWRFPSLPTKTVVLINQNEVSISYISIGIGNYKNPLSYQKEYDNHGRDIESNINFINVGGEKASANLMEVWQLFGKWPQCVYCKELITV